MNKIFELLLHEVHRKYKSERAFYHSSLGITQRAWEKYKSGDTDFNNIKLSTYKRMVDLLFTPYESMLIGYAIDNLNEYKNVIDAFHHVKLQHAHEMLKNGAVIIKNSGIMDDSRDRFRPLTKVYITDSLGNSISFQISIPSNLPKDKHLRVPSGQRNKLEWFKNYFEEVVVK